jgi:hypothetical protein
MSALELTVAAAPETAPFQCVCGNGVPADGPYVRLPVRNRVGDVWLCGSCQEVVLASNRLMSLRLYEERVAHVTAALNEERVGLSAERSRLADIEQRWTDATQEASEATARAEEAAVKVAQAQQTIADLERLVREQSERAEQAERGSFSLQSLEARWDRWDEIVAENAGPESNGASKRAPKAATVKGAK